MCLFGLTLESSLLLLLAIICACMLAHDGRLTLNVIGYTARRTSDPITQAKSLNGNNTTTPQQSRDELLNNISSYNDLHKVLVKFSNFIEIFTHSANNNASSISKITTSHSGSIGDELVLPT